MDSHRGSTLRIRLAKLRPNHQHANKWVDRLLKPHQLNPKRNLTAYENKSHDSQTPDYIVRRHRIDGCLWPDDIYMDWRGRRNKHHQPRQLDPNRRSPSGATQDTAQWDNQVLGNLLITYNNGLPGTGFGTSGINLDLTTNQVGSVDLVPVGGATGNIGINDISILSATAAFGLGDASTKRAEFYWATSGRHPRFYKRFSGRGRH